MSDFTSKKYVPAPITTRAPGAPRYVSVARPTLSANEIAYRATHGHARYVPAGHELAQEPASFAPNVTTPQTLDNIVFPLFYKGFDGGNTTITFWYKLPEGSGGLNGNLVFRSPYTSGPPVSIPVGFPKIQDSCSYQLTSEIQHTHNNTLYTHVVPRTEFVKGCDATTSLPSDYLRDIRLQISFGKIRLTGVKIVFNGVTICDTRSAAPIGSDNISLTDIWVNRYLAEILGATDSSSHNAVCNRIVQAVRGEFGNAWHPKYTRNEYVPYPPNLNAQNDTPRRDIWPRTGGENSPFRPAPNSWCTTFAAWAIWQGLGYSPITNVNDIEPPFIDRGAYLSPMPQYPYQGRVTQYADLGKVKSGFLGRLQDGQHAVIFVKWINNPFDQTEVPFDPDRTLNISLLNDGNYEPVHANYFLGVGGAQGPPVCGWPFPVLTLTQQQLGKLSRPWKFMVSYSSPSGGPAYCGQAILWDRGAQQYSRHYGKSMLYQDGFGNPGFFMPSS